MPLNQSRLLTTRTSLRPSPTPLLLRERMSCKSRPIAESKKMGRLIQNSSTPSLLKILLLFWKA